MRLSTHNDRAALYRADKAVWQQMRLQETSLRRGDISGDTATAEGQRRVHAGVRRGGARVPAGVATRGAVVGAQRPERSTRQEGRSEGEKGGV